MKEEKAIDSKLLDSSVWIAYLLSSNYANIIDSNEILGISVLSLFEIKRKLLNDRIPEKEVNSFIFLIKERSSYIFDIDEKIAVNAALISAEKKLPALDSLIYSSALENSFILYTLDNDFRGLSNVKMLE